MQLHLERAENYVKGLLSLGPTNPFLFLQTYLLSRGSGAAAIYTLT